MSELITGVLVLLASFLCAGWLFMMYDCLRDAICPPREWQRHWKWRLAAMSVFIVTMCGGILVILLVSSVVVGVQQHV